MHDRPCPLARIAGIRPSGQIVRRKEIDLELLAQDRGFEIFYRADLPIGGVVEDRCELPVRQPKGFLSTPSDGPRIGEFEMQASTPASRRSMSRSASVRAVASTRQPGAHQPRGRQSDA